MLFKIQMEKALERVATLEHKNAVVPQWRTRIKAMGITVRSFCKVCAIREESFSRWVNGIQEPDDENMLLVQHALAVMEHEKAKRNGP